MKPVKAVFEADFLKLGEKLRGLDLPSGRDLNRQNLRERIVSSGRRILELNPAAPALEVGMLCADSSSAEKELRYHALWGVHSVCVHCVFDGRLHDDVLVGHGKVSYRDLAYSSEIDFGSIVPYSEVDSRANSLRVFHELDSLLDAIEEAKTEGRRANYILVDGSLHTNLENLSKKAGSEKEGSMALEALKKLLKLSNVVGCVEDSHATDLARELGFDYTNMLLFDVALNPGEYVVDERNNISICYVKLPGKKVSYLPSNTSAPLTVRWEFNKKDFKNDLNAIAGMWLSEDDLVHPQPYPLRIADYLTRSIRIHGVLDELVRERDLEQKFRELREI